MSILASPSAARDKVIKPTPAVAKVNDVLLSSKIPTNTPPDPAPIKQMMEFKPETTPIDPLIKPRTNLDQLTEDFRLPLDGIGIENDDKSENESELPRNTNPKETAGRPSVFCCCVS